MRSTHTTKQKKAKCLVYRNGKRCGRVGKILVSYTDRQGYHRYPVCAECAAKIEADGGTIIERSKRGYYVVTGGFGIATREYRRIE